MEGPSWHSLCWHCQNSYVHLSRHNEQFENQWNDFLSCIMRSPTIAAQWSEIDRITAIEQKLECVGALIFKTFLLRKEIATTKNRVFSLKQRRRGAPENPNSQDFDISTCIRYQKAESPVFDVRINTEKAKIFQRVEDWYEPECFLKIVNTLRRNFF